MTRSEIDLESCITTIPNSVSSSASEKEGRQNSWREYLMQDVNPSCRRATALFSGFFFMSGFINSISFAAVFVWCGFQTGNTVQLSLALSRLFAPGQTDLSLQTADRQALVSLLSFALGGLFARAGDRVGNNTRLWLCLGTFTQAVLTALAAVTIHLGGQSAIASKRGAPAWTNAWGDVTLGLASASMGMQGVMAKRVRSEFNACIVLTTTWVELVGDMGLFTLAKNVKTRNHRVYAILTAFLGGFVGFAILERVSDAGAFGVGTGIRVLMAVGWLFVPAKHHATDSVQY